MKNTGVGAERLSFDGDGSAGHRVLVGIWGDARSQTVGKNEFVVKKQDVSNI